MATAHGLENKGEPAAVSVNQYASIQAAIDANPGRMIQVAAGDYLIGQALRIKTSGTGLYGFGRIIQTNAAASIVEIRQATNALLRDLTLMRPPARADTTEHAVSASDCDGVELDRLRVIDNRSLGGTLLLERCRNSRVQNCIVKNYKRIGIDDRTGSDLYGYAFHAIDGTGILITESEGVTVHNNHVIEANIYPTRETKERHQLGQLTAGRKPVNKGKLAPRGDYVNNWHQGSAITITSPEKTRFVQVIGNYIENAVQGIDLHADQVICIQNIIRHAFVGIKCMHGSRNACHPGATLPLRCLHHARTKTGRIAFFQQHFSPRQKRYVQPGVGRPAVIRSEFQVMGLASCDKIHGWEHCWRKWFPDSKACRIR